MSERYPIAPNGIFTTFNGEHAFLGVRMHFIRFAGCSVGCYNCDTDYTVAERLSIAEIVERLQRLNESGAPKLPIWFTGGEPTDHNLRPLRLALTQCDYHRVILATSGVRRLPRDEWEYTVDLCSEIVVSPHGQPDDLKQRVGTVLNLVPGLGGLNLADWTGRNDIFQGFSARYVTPLWSDGVMANVGDCIEFIRANPTFRLGIQAHKFWGIA